MVLLLFSSDVIDAPSEHLEFFAHATPQAVIAALLPAIRDQQIAGAVVVNTCNRFEVYLEAADEPCAIRAGMSAVAAVLSAPQQTVRDGLRIRRDAAVVQHLFAVTSGLRSLVVGDAEIAGQVKRALLLAQNSGTMTTHLHALFQQTLRVSKRVNRETRVASAGSSVIHAALEAARAQSDGFTGCTALIVGTGAYSRVVAAALERFGTTQIGVYSRSGHEPQFSGQRPVMNVPAHELVQWLSRVDLVVAASGSPGYAFDVPLALRVAETRDPQHRLWCVDVSASTDIDPGIAALQGFELIDMSQVAQYAPPHAEEAVDAATQIIDTAAGEFMRYLRVRESDTTVVALRAHITQLIAAELTTREQHNNEMPPHQLQRTLHRVTRELLHTPTMNVKAHASAGRLDECNRALYTLFGIEVPRAH